MSGDRTRSKAGNPTPDDSMLSIEDLFAEAVAAVESISSSEVELAPDSSPPPGVEELEIDISEPEPEPEPSISEEEIRLLEKRAARRAKLKNRMTELERARDEAIEERATLRTETIRLKATNQRLRERLDRLQSQNEDLEDARQTADQHATRVRDAQRRLAEDLRHLQERRRQEQEEQKQHGQAPAILATLPILDHLQMAFDHAAAEPEQIIQGVEMVIGQFHGVLRRLGVERIDCAPGAAFMPELHEAMLHTPTGAVPVGHIVQEISAGYNLNGRLLRAARVSVAAAALEVSEESTETPQSASEADSESGPAQEELLFVIPPELREE
ncbi:MAG: molecular chaperone GrpE [Myxococcota bacterium]